MLARIPIHVRPAPTGSHVAVTPVPFTFLGCTAPSVDDAWKLLEPQIKEHLARMYAVDRLPFAEAQSAQLIRVPVTTRCDDVAVDVTLGVVTIDRQIQGRTVTLAYPVAIPGLEITVKEASTFERRITAAARRAMGTWRASSVVASDEPPTTSLEERAIEVEEREDEDETNDESILETLGADLTRTHSQRLDRRDDLVRRVLETLSAPGRSSVVLVGPPDVGKSALVHEVARRIASSDAPADIAKARVWRISANELIAGAQYTGQWQDRVRRLVEDARRTRAIVAMGDPIGIIDAGRWSKSDNNASRFLRPYIESGEITVICECTPEQFALAQRREPGFIDGFHRVDVAEPTREQARDIARDLAQRLQEKLEVEISEEAIDAAIELTTRFEPYRSLPGKTTRLIEDTVRERDPDSRRLDRAAVLETFCRRTGLPAAVVADDVRLDVSALKQHFEERVLGQGEATDAVVDAIAIVKAGLNNPAKPLASFFFVGPTGVGKTELAKVLAEYLFGHRDRLIRVDMGEYAGNDAVAKLIGSPWRDEEGDLTRQVRSQPFCVVLLDELEKAHPSVFDALLAALGEGRLTDSSGRTADFRNAIVIMTSNLGATRTRVGRIGFSETEANDSNLAYVEEAERFFRPEFVNRIDRIVVFRSLTPDIVRRIARREFDELLARQGLVRRGVAVELDEAVVDIVAGAGFDAKYGARPLQRAIERTVIAPLARLLVRRPLQPGEFLRIHATEGRIGIQATREETVEAPSVRRARRPERDDGALERIDAEATAFRATISADPAADLAGELRPAVSELIEQTHSRDFWSDGEHARTTLRQIYRLERVINRYDRLAERAEGLCQLTRRLKERGDRSRVGEATAALAAMADELLVTRLELAAAASADAESSVRVEVTPVGAESAEWAKRLVAMYVAWSERTGREVSIASDGLSVVIDGWAAWALLAHESGLHRHVRANRFESLARVQVVAIEGPGEATPESESGLVVRVYEEGRHRGVRDPRNGARESHVNAVLEDGRIDGFLIAALREG